MFPAHAGAGQREFVVRTAVGASAMRLARQCLTESLVIAVLGSTLGAIAAWRGNTFLLRFFRDPMMMESMSVHPDKSIFWISMAFAVASKLLPKTEKSYKINTLPRGGS